MIAESRNCLIGPSAERARACRIACELAHSNSCYHFGTYLEQNKKDLMAAIVRYEQGCSGGSGLACRAAGHKHARGAGVVANATKAAAFYKNGRNYGRVHCEQGHAASCLATGEMFAAGEGGPPDRATAVLYLQRACSYKLQAGCVALERIKN